MSSELDGIKQFEAFGMPAFISRKGNATRRAVLESNHMLRQGRIDKPSHLGFGGVQLRIPELDYRVLRVTFPDLNSKDHEIRTRAWQKLANSPLGELYRTDRKTRGQQCRSITAR